MTISERHTYPLSILIFLLGIATAIAAAAMVIHSYSPIPFGDQWDVVADIMSDTSHPIEHLWSLHNEHRIVVGRLAVEADLFWFGGRNISLLIEIFTVQLLHFGVFAWVVRRYGMLSKPAWWTACGFLLFLFLTLSQAENLIWGIEITYVMAGFAASIAFACASRCGEAVQSGARFPVWVLLLGMLSALVSECSLANGVFVWPIFSVVAFRFRFPKMAQFFLGAVGASAIVAYLINYANPSHHSNPIDTIRQPLALGRYAIIYFATMWNSQAPASNWLSTAELLVVLTILVALAAAVRFIVKRNSVTPLNGFLAANVVFVMGAATMTALGRLRFGLEQATASRYQTITLVFWACFGAYLLAWCTRAARSATWLFQIEVGMLALMLGAIPRFINYNEFATARQEQIRRGFSALARGSNDADALRLLFPTTSVLPTWYASYRQRNWGPDPREYGGSLNPPAPELAPVGSRASSSKRQLSEFHLTPPGRCLGFFDVAKPAQDLPGYTYVAGWAWDKQLARIPERILLGTDDGTEIGTAQFNTSRPDVVRANSFITNPVTGFNTTVSAPSGTTVKAFAVLQDGKSVCELNNLFQIP